MHHLDEHIKGLLSQLGYQPGDDLTKLEKEDWTEAGFKKLEWNRVLEAAALYRRMLKGKGRAT